MTGKQVVALLTEAKAPNAAGTLGADVSPLQAAAYGTMRAVPSLLAVITIVIIVGFWLALACAASVEDGLDFQRR